MTTVNHEIKAAELRIALFQTQIELLQYKTLFGQKQLEALIEAEKIAKKKAKAKPAAKPTAKPAAKPASKERVEKKDGPRTE